MPTRKTRMRIKRSQKRKTKRLKRSQKRRTKRVKSKRRMRGGAGGGAALPTATEARETAVAAAERRLQNQQLAEFSLQTPVGYVDQPDEVIRLELLDPNTSFLDLVKRRRVNRATKEIVDSILKDENLLRQKLLVNERELAGLYHMTFWGPGLPGIPTLHKNYEVILKEIVQSKWNRTPKFQSLRVLGEMGPEIISEIFWLRCRRDGMSEVKTVQEFLDIRETPEAHVEWIDHHDAAQLTVMARGTNMPLAVAAAIANVRQIRSSPEGAVMVASGKNRPPYGTFSYEFWVWGNKIKSNNNGSVKIIETPSGNIETAERDRQQGAVVGTIIKDGELVSPPLPPSLESAEERQRKIDCGEIIAKGFRDLPVERKIKIGIIGGPLIIQHDSFSGELDIIRCVNADDETPYFI